MAGSSCKQLIHSENHEGKNCFQLAVVGRHVEVSTTWIASTSYRVFSRNVTAAMLGSLNIGTAAVLLSPTILGELNSILIQTFFFCSWLKYMLIDHVSQNSL